MSSPFYNKTEVKSRGWTDTAITNFLGDPDQVSRNRGRRKGKVNLYRKDRVEACENTQRWKEWKQKSLKRSEAMKKTADTQREETIRVATDALGKITLADEVRGLSKEELTQRASANFLEIEARRAKHRRNYVPEQVTSRRTDKFFHRIIVNYLRHDGTVYDKELDEYFRRTGVNTAKDMVREHVYVLIAREYPWLEDECERQLELRRKKMQRKGQL